MPAKIKILHLVTTLELGGAQGNALTVALGLDPQRYAVYFASSSGGALYPVPQAHLAEVKYFSCLRRAIDPVRDLCFMVQFFIYCRRHAFDIVHTHSSKAGIIGRWAAWAAGVPVRVHTVHGWSFHDYMPRLLRGCARALEKITARITTRFIVVARSDRDKGLREVDADPKKYALVHYGIDVRRFSSAASMRAVPAALPFRSDLPIVGMIACLKPQKNPHDFIALAAALTGRGVDARFIIVGDGVMRGAVRAAIQRAGLCDRVYLLGWRRDVDLLLARMDVVVMTSLWEGMPIALIEAMASAKPVVAYAVDGVPELVQHGLTGYVIPPRDLAALVESTEVLVRDPLRRSQMGAAAHAMMRDHAEYGTEAMCRNIDALYHDLMRVTES